MVKDAMIVNDNNTLLGDTPELVSLSYLGPDPEALMKSLTASSLSEEERIVDDDIGNNDAVKIAAVVVLVSVGLIGLGLLIKVFWL